MRARVGAASRGWGSLPRPVVAGHDAHRDAVDFLGNPEGATVRPGREMHPEDDHPGRPLTSDVDETDLGAGEQPLLESRSRGPHA